MMKNKKITLSALAILVVFAACRIEIGTNLKVSRLVKLSKENKFEYLAPGRIFFEVVSNEDCIEDTKYLTELLAGYFDEVKNPECIEEGMDDYFSLTTRSKVIFSKETGKIKSDQLVQYVVSNHSGKIRLTAYFNQHAFNELNRKVDEKFYSKIDIDELAILFDLENDTSKPLKYTTEDVYINGQPFPFVTEEEIDVDDIHRFRLSDILRDYIVHERSVRLIEFDI